MPKPFLDAITFKSEGAFRLHDPKEMALYGYNFSNFLRHAPEIWHGMNADQKNKMHPRVKTLMDTVAKGGPAARTAAEGLFLGVRDRTKPLPGTTDTTDQPRNQDADTLLFLESAKRIVRPLSEENYSREYGLGLIRDSAVRHITMDATYIRPYFAQWGPVYIAKKLGLLTDEKATQLGYVYISASEANDPKTMRTKGHAYQDKEAFAEVAKLLNNATPDQKRLMPYYLAEARDRFFERTVEVEGIRSAAALKKPEEKRDADDHDAIRLYAAHHGKDAKGRDKNPTKGWLNRNDNALAFYYDSEEVKQLGQLASHYQAARVGLPDKVQMAEAAPPRAPALPPIKPHNLVLDGQYQTTLGANYKIAWQAEDKGQGSAILEINGQTIRWMVDQNNWHTTKGIGGHGCIIGEVPPGITYVPKGQKTAMVGMKEVRNPSPQYETLLFQSGGEIIPVPLKPQLNHDLANANKRTLFGFDMPMPMGFTRDGRGGLDDDASAKVIFNRGVGPDHPDYMKVYPRGTQVAMSLPARGSHQGYSK